MEFDWKITGHDRQVAYLQKQIESGKINHAYVFLGGAGLGKLNITLRFVQSLYCEHTQAVPCNKCSSCKQINKHTFPDFYYIEPLEKKNDISVKQIRNLRSSFSKRAFYKGWQVAVINKAHLLNIQAANALLKTLEEPGKKQIIILIVEDMAKLPSTIISRCQVLKFIPLSKDKIKDYLKQTKLDEDKIDLVSRLSAGYPEKAGLYASKTSKLTEYNDILKWSVQLFSCKNIAEKISILDKKINKISKDNKKIKILTQHWIGLWRDVFMVKNNQHDLIINSGYKSEIEKIAANTQLTEIKKYLNGLSKFDQLDKNINYKLWIENIIIN